MSHGRLNEFYFKYFLQEACGTDGPTNSNLVSSPSLFPCTSSNYSDVPSLGASNYLDSIPTSTVNRIAGWNPKDLGTLLMALGLEKYISKYEYKLDYLGNLI